ncbi:serine/threonine-protein kinase [Hyalangium rubrum]|uniref:Serine/threonine-protein kinase n=1 Tax=Hyalangium rubrum TaxID=3103134 RepID=A0ABU5HLJ8_9BACT|nr:serine/threonine-protein kinase [Hyalangium sp. s54d21]MDY7232975.1 serine/threonine-protein kinase [Hyalangium sp. s54d21]
MPPRFPRRPDGRAAATAPTVDDAAAAQPASGKDTPAECTEGSRREMPPRRLERFVLLEELGVGGMGMVFAAFDERLDRKVAIKVVRPQRRDGEGVAQERLLREAQALARLSHPNVVAVYEAGVLPDGDVFIAMEFVKGGSLRQWQRAPGRSWREILSAYVAAGTGLSAAHQAGIVHRDFKPDNVLVAGDGRVRVLDFGLALATAPAREEVAGAAVALAGAGAGAGSAGVSGTPGYMAPEQFSGGALDARTDQFSFCVSLYEALYGERPFADFAFARAAGEPGEAQRRARPAELHARWLWETIDRGLSPRPEERFPTMEALLEALTRDHGRSRRRLVAVGAITLLVAGTSAASLYLQDLRPRCETSAAELAGVWDEAARQRVRTALLDTRFSYAADAWRAVEARLDQYAERWLAASQDACEATHVRHVQSPELLDRRMECLSARKRSLAAATEVFTTHPARSAERSGAILDGLGDLGVCADSGVLRLGLPPPKETQGLEQLDALRRHLARGEALLAAGELAEASAELGKAEQVETRLAYLPARGEVLLLRGRLELQHGRSAEGEARLRDALEVATESRHDELVADTWLTLARDAGASHRPLEEAREWVRQADAWLRRLGHGDDRRRLDVAHARGNIQMAGGQHREAVETFTQALAEATARRVEEVRLVPLLRGRAIAFAATGEAPKALADYQRALALSLAAWGPGHPDVATTRRALGVLQIERLGQVEQGRREIEQAANIYRAAQGEDAPDVGHCEAALSQAEMFRGDYAAALAHAERADAIFERTLGAEHRRRGETLMAIGVLRFMRKDYAGSLTAYERARGILEANLGAEHIDVGVLVSNIGETLLALGESEAALRNFEQALVILRRGLGPSHPNLAFPLKGVGLAHLDRRHYALAREAFEASLALREKTPGGGDPQELAETRWGLARALGGLGVEPARRRELSTAALETYRTLGPDWADRAREISRSLAAR